MNLKYRYIYIYIYINLQYTINLHLKVVFSHVEKQNEQTQMFDDTFGEV